MKTIIKQRLLTALLLISLNIGQAHAWTFTTSGLITSGFDNTGIFGIANEDLTGLAYTQTLTIDPNQYEYQYTNPYNHYGNGSLVAGTATETVTVNGLKQSYLLDLTQTNYGQAVLYNALTQGLVFGVVGRDSASQEQGGYTRDGQHFFSLAYVDSYANPFNIGLGYTQIWSYSPQVGDTAYAFFQKNGPDGLTQFVSSPSFISINAATAVPEPTGLLLLALGLIGLAIIHRKSSLKAKTSA